MLGSDYFIGCIDHLKISRHDLRIKSLNRHDRRAIRLESILQELDFGYDIIKGELKLIDFRCIDSCGIESEMFSIDSNLSTVILDRLYVYINDCILEPIREDLRSVIYKRPENLSEAKDVLKNMQEYPYMFSDKQFLLVEAIIDPTKVRIDNIIRNIKRSN